MMNLNMVNRYYIYTRKRHGALALTISVIKIAARLLWHHARMFSILVNPRNDFIIRFPRQKWSIRFLRWTDPTRIPLACAVLFTAVPQQVLLSKPANRTAALKMLEEINRKYREKKNDLPDACVKPAYEVLSIGYQDLLKWLWSWKTNGICTFVEKKERFLFGIILNLFCSLWSNKYVTGAKCKCELAMRVNWKTWQKIQLLVANPFRAFFLWLNIINVQLINY